MKDLLDRWPIYGRSRSLRLDRAAESPGPLRERSRRLVACRMPEQQKPCPREQELIADVQHHLMRISELTRDIAEGLAKGHENLAAELDKQVDLEIGAKERGMGALHQHRKEHGC